MRSIITQLYEALSSELEVYFGDKKVFVDWKRLQGGDFYNEALSQALCQSVCMIVVFLPIYFDDEHTFCAREYKAMEYLENHRLNLLNPDEKQHGLIIPIVFRGLDDLPTDIKAKRHYHNFTNYLSVNNMCNEREYLKIISDIALYIYNRYKTLKENLHIDHCAYCNNFKLPTENEIRDWLQSIKSNKSNKSNFPR